MDLFKNKNYLFLILFSLLHLFNFNEAYKPVILLHGILAGRNSLDILKLRIQDKHPGTEVINIDLFVGWSSLENMWHQVEKIGQQIYNISKCYPDGIHFLGYSQGALLGRTILQAFPDHNVKHYISLSGPQAGQYGTAFLHLIFPNIALKSAFELFYSRVGQHTSVGNYWNDPKHQELYYKYSQYLPYVNNAIVTNKSQDFKNGILNLKKLILIGGPNDNVITPWESSQFGFYDDNNTVINLINRDIYKDDLIGLKILDKNGRLKVFTVPGVNHFMWHVNLTVIDNYILPFLD